MANRVRLRITGISELRHAIKAYGDRLVSASVAAVAAAVKDTVADARAAAPVKTGRLRDSITGTVQTDGYSVRGTVRAKAPHAHLIEFGTQRVAKKPFLVPAAVRHRRQMNEALASAVRTHAPDALGTPRMSGEGPGTPRVSID